MTGEYLPSEGIVSIEDLSQLTGITKKTLVSNLRKNKIPILKLGGFFRQQFVRFEDLRGVPHGK